MLRLVNETVLVSSKKQKLQKITILIFKKILLTNKVAKYKMICQDMMILLFYEYVIYEMLCLLSR